jgi:hypothetical protein
MRNYINYKPPLIVKQGWIFCSSPNFKAISVNSDQIAALLFISKKKEIGIIYRPTPVAITDGKQLGIIGNMLEEGSTPTIIKINGKEVGLCFTIQNYEDIPEIFCPKIPLQAKMVKDTEWEEVTKNIALIVLATLAPLPFGRDIESTMLYNDFMKEMAKIIIKHGFRAKMMVDALEQEDTIFDTLPVINNLNVSKAYPKAVTHATLLPKAFEVHGLETPAHPSIPLTLGENRKSSRQK